jgi:hypothetical protein
VTITVVLDTTAILAYTKGSIAVGELLSLITDDGDTALVPATCLAEAQRRVTGHEDALLSILPAIACVETGPLLPDQATEVGVAARGRGGIDAGHAALEAVAREAQLVTQDVALMSRLLPPDWPILEL